MRQIARTLFGLYAWLVLVVIVLFTALAVAVLPGLERRRKLARSAARAVFVLCAIPVERHGAPLPRGASVVVANHASYLDGIILFAELPTSFSFIVKREMTAVPVAHLLLRRIGTQFVERFDARRGTVDARRILRSAGAGASLAAFPEGTFRREPGLGLFRQGAFVAAVRAGLPVVPMTIRGSREILPAERWLPVPGRIDITVHEPIPCSSEGGKAEIARVRDAARAAILSSLGEPGLDYRLEMGTTPVADDG